MYHLGEAADWINRRLPVGYRVAVELRERRVLTTDGPPVEGIDFVFVPVGSPTDEVYLREVEVAYRLSCQAFRSLPAAKQSTS